MPNTESPHPLRRTDPDPLLKMGFRREIHKELGRDRIARGGRTQGAERHRVPLFREAVDNSPCPRMSEIRQFTQQPEDPEISLSSTLIGIAKWDLKQGLPERLPDLETLPLCRERLEALHQSKGIIGPDIEPLNEVSSLHKLKNF